MRPAAKVLRWPIRGFTFIEIVAAIAVLEIVIVSALTMFSFGNRIESIVEENLVATNLMQAKVEEIKCQPFIQDVTVSGFSYNGYPDYLFDVTQSVNHLGNPYLKKIMVTCSWTSVVNIPKQQRVTFLVADY